MSGKKNVIMIFQWTLAVSLLASFFAVMLVSHAYSRMQFEQLNAICAEMLRQEPEAEEMVFSALKAYKKKSSSNFVGKTIRTLGNVVTSAEDMSTPAKDRLILAEDTAKKEILSLWGYQKTDFAALSCGKCALAAVMGVLAGMVLLRITLFSRNQWEAKRIHGLTDYLEQVNTGKAPVLSVSGEDDFSKLEDEIYKTVTSLYQTRDAAIQARNDFAQNLANIAHQIKTPITAIFLSVQMMRENEKQSRRKQDAGHNNQNRDTKQEADRNHLEQVQKQLMRLTHLEEALLLLSRMYATGYNCHRAVTFICYTASIGNQTRKEKPTGGRKWKFYDARIFRKFMVQAVIKRWR